MVIDTSALVAILRLEAEAADFLGAIARSPVRLVSAVSALEAAMVLSGARRSPGAWQPLDELLTDIVIRVEPFDAAQASFAREAFLRFGKGRHPAALTTGDCASYALAMSRQLPLHFKGADFARTDVRIAAYGL